MNLPPWSPALKIVASVFHGVAIACTVFRLMYRWYMTRFWWEDGWAALALTVDVMCLVSALLDAPATAQGIPPINDITNWMAALGFPSVLWACRTSILVSIVRVANPSQQLRRIALLVGYSFLVIWAALMAQKIQICVMDECKVAASVGLSQLITDVISDLSLVVLPVYLLRRTKITQRQRIMIFSAFSASLLITAVTILHSAVLFTVHSSGTIVIGHAKTALSLIVCNFLVIVAFVYRMCRRGRDLDATDELSLTSVDLNTGLTDSTADKCTATVTLHSMVSEASRSTMAGTVEVEEKGEGSVESSLA